MTRPRFLPPRLPSGGYSYPDILRYNLQRAELDTRRTKNGLYNVLVDKITGREWGIWFADDINKVCDRLTHHPFDHIEDPGERNAILEEAAAARCAKSKACTDGE